MVIASPSSRPDLFMSNAAHCHAPQTSFVVKSELLLEGSGRIASLPRSNTKWPKSCLQPPSIRYNKINKGATWSNHTFAQRLVIQSQQFIPTLATVQFGGPGGGGTSVISVIANLEFIADLCRPSLVFCYSNQHIEYWTTCLAILQPFSCRPKRRVFYQEAAVAPGVGAMSTVSMACHVSVR